MAQTLDATSSRSLAFAVALHLSALIVPFASSFFELAPLTPAIVGLGLGGALLGAAVAPLSSFARSRVR